MIDSSYMVYGLRKHLEDVLGVPSVVKYVGYKQPEEDNFTTVSFINSESINETKNKDLITEKAFFQIGNYAQDIVTLGEQQKKINEILRYAKIPIIDVLGETVGHFSVVDITGGANIPYGVAIEDETESIRNFTDFVTDIQHVKVRNID